MGKDGYEWLTRFDRGFLKKHSLLRQLLLAYYRPFVFEKKGHGLIYRWLGVHVFGRFLPTGGIQIRRWTKSSMPAYTLKARSLAAALEFRYKSCLFETLHLPFLIALLWRSLWWYFEHHNSGQALELLLVNAVFNIYPVMHQRYTRIRVARLIARHIKKEHDTRG